MPNATPRRTALGLTALEDRTTPAAYTPVQQQAAAVFQIASSVYQSWPQAQAQARQLAQNPATAGTARVIYEAYANAPAALKGQVAAIVPQLDAELRTTDAALEKLRTDLQEQARQAPQRAPALGQQLVDLQKVSDELRRANAEARYKAQVSSGAMDLLGGYTRAELAAQAAAAEAGRAVAESAAVQAATQSAADVVSGLQKNNPNRQANLARIFQNSLNDAPGALTPANIAALFQQGLISKEELAVYVRALMAKQQAARPAPAAEDTGDTGGSAGYTPPVVTVAPERRGGFGYDENGNGRLDPGEPGY